jgi:hypothetical protein
MMKQETVCRCLRDVALLNDCPARREEVMKFYKDREYQVDVLYDNDVYRVYMTGDWEHYSDMIPEEFESCFLLIP